MNAFEILQADAVAWKKRALAAEAKVHGYRVLRGHAHKVFRASLEDGRPELDAAIDDLSAELDCLDQVHPKFAPFAQTTTKLKENFVVRETFVKDAPVSDLDLMHRVIAINGMNPEAAKAVGLLFQLVQIADIAAAKGSEHPRVDAGWIQDRAPALLVLLIAFGLLNPEVAVDVAEIAALEAASWGG